MKFNFFTYFQFASFLLFILLVQIAVAVYAFIVVKNDDNFRNISEKYQEIFNGYFLNSESKDFIDFIQKNVSTVIYYYFITSFILKRKRGEIFRNLLLNKIIK